MDYSEEYRNMLTNFTAGRTLDYDLDEWPDADLDDFNKLDEELVLKYQEYLQSKGIETEDEDFYIIDMIIDTENGPDSSTVDVRTLPLEKLSKLCSVFPQYNNYYFRKVAESL